MQDEEFDNWLKTSARSYNQPPAPDVEGMWAEIEKQHFDGVTTHTPQRAQWWNSGALRIAAALVIGLGLGRISASPELVMPASTPSVAQLGPAGKTPDVLPVLNAPEANRYLGETVALLASLQADARTSRSDRQLVSGAAELLNTTRFLLDSPNSNKSSVRGLLEDLELVLAQIVQLSNSGSATDIDLINQAMEQRDVMPRLRTAVANNYSAE
jgi:hypothetical protein